MGEKRIIEEIWQIIKRLGESQKETDRHQKETDRHQKETDRQLRESQKETDRQLRESQKETDRQLRESQKETDRKIKETDRRLKQLDELFTGQWGKLMESLIEGDLIHLLQERGIDVIELSQVRERKWEGQTYEFDLVAINGSEVVVVEVKTTLRVKDLDSFISKLESFKEIFPYHSKKKIYGAVAYLKANEGTDKLASKKGLFVIRATGSSASIVNDKNFKPRKF